MYIPTVNIVLLYVQNDSPSEQLTPILCFNYAFI